MLRKVKLHGSLRDQFVDELELNVNTGPQVVLAMRSIFPAYRRFERENPNLMLVLSEEEGKNARAVEENFFNGSFGKMSEVHMVLAEEGAGIEIAAMIGIKHAFAAFVVNTLASMAFSAVISSVMQSIAPTPKTGAGKDDQVAQKQSFIFNGPVNVQEQGGAVPIIYGHFMVGSTVVSVSVDVDQLLTVPSRAALPSTGEPTPETGNPPTTEWQWAS